MDIQNSLASRLPNALARFAREAEIALRESTALAVICSSRNLMSLASSLCRSASCFTILDDPARPKQDPNNGAP